ncbi:unnamed protein product [Tenebrio molitor]|nr:unnamed protein product [Tenebrio molitor]
MFLKSLVFLFPVIKTITGQVPFLGPCPEYKTVQNFDLNKYLGKWFEAERYFAVFEFGGKCVTADYNYDNNGAVNIINQQISALTGIRSTIEGLGNHVGRSDEARLSVSFPSLPVNFDAPYWVLDTDYDNYSVVWSCSNFGIFSTRKTNYLDIFSQRLDTDKIENPLVKNDGKGLQHPRQVLNKSRLLHQN